MHSPRVTLGVIAPVLLLASTLISCGGGGGGGSTATPPAVINLDPSAIFQGSIMSTTYAPVDVTEGIILSTGEARLLLRNGSQIVANLQITGSTFISSALELNTSSQQAITISNGKINSTAVGSGQANLSGNFNTFNDSGTFTLYSTAPLSSTSSPKSLNNLVGAWTADAVAFPGSMNVTIDSSGRMSGNATGQFTQITPNSNGFRITISYSGQTYTGLAYTFGNTQFADTFLAVLASNASGELYAVFHH